MLPAPAPCPELSTLLTISPFKTPNPPDRKQVEQSYVLPEERTLGPVTGDTYGTYLSSGGWTRGVVVAILLLGR